MKLFRFLVTSLIVLSSIVTLSSLQLVAQTDANQVDTNSPSRPAIEVLDPALQVRLDRSVKRSLAWLAAQQRPDGSFPSDDFGQPAVTSLCVLSFLANGESINEGQYSAVLQKAIGYVIAQQKPNGLIARRAPAEWPIDRNVEHQIGQTAVYNHAISALALTESYGQLNDELAKRTLAAIEKAILATIEMQSWKKLSEEKGGWRQIDKEDEHDSDLSITGWMLMFLRSAHNAGFNVPLENINLAVNYVEACYKKSHGTFGYVSKAKNDLAEARFTRAMAGAGILALAHAGKHETPQSQKAGDWVLKLGFNKYDSNDSAWSKKKVFNDRYHYGLLTCCHALYQLGGKQ